jgi:hypothetical protein
MSQHDELLRDTIAKIAEGTPVDWAALEASVGSESFRAILDELKVVAGVADFARTPASSPLTLTHGEPGDAATSWGHLQLLEKVGQGAFGEVYRAWDTRLGREVALKLLTRGATGPDALPSSIIDEGHLLARVRHPNVVTV